jgi:hypothetical protein
MMTAIADKYMVIRQGRYVADYISKLLARSFRETDRFYTSRVRAGPGAEKEMKASVAGVATSR